MTEELCAALTIATGMAGLLCLLVSCASLDLFPNDRGGTLLCILSWICSALFFFFFACLVFDVFKAELRLYEPNQSKKIEQQYNKCVEELEREWNGCPDLKTEDILADVSQFSKIELPEPRYLAFTNVARKITIKFQNGRVLEIIEK